MFHIRKTFQISASHSLDLPYDSPCKRIHGHNWKITIFVKGDKLNAQGMLIDFREIKRKIHGPLDHQHLNYVLPEDPFGEYPTAENLAKWIQEQIPGCYKVEVEESADNAAIYEV